MIRLQRVVRSVSLLAVLVGAVAAFAAPTPGPVPPDSATMVVTIGQIAAQLGVRVPNRAEEEFQIGVSFTGSLEDTLKFEEYIKGMHAGARVTVARVGPDRVYIEADEIDPPQRKNIRVRMNADGTLVKPPKV